MEETPRSFVHAMEGAALAEKKRYDLAFYGAWHTEAFARMEGRKLNQAFDARFAEQSSTPKLQNAKGIAFFHRLQARGFPVDITRH